MPDPQLYRKKIVEFLEKWISIIPVKTRDDFFELEKWVKSYDNEMKSRSIEEKKIYHRKGISLLQAIAKNYQKDHIDFLTLLQTCRMKLLQNDSSCSIKTKNELLLILKEYREFISELVGCFKENDDRYILTLSKKAADLLGDEWKKKVQDIDTLCYQWRFDKIKE